MDVEKSVAIPQAQGHSPSQTDELLEFACVVKTICDNYCVHPSDLRNFPPVDHVLSLTDKLLFKKRIVVYIPIPTHLAPRDCDPYLRLARLRMIDSGTTPYSMSATKDKSQLGRLGIGLGEFELRVKENKKIRFWIWNGGQDYYMFGGTSLYFVHKDDVLALTRFIKKDMRLAKRHIDMPILPNEVLEEIYKNSIEFLLKGREMQDKYKKYRISYKRGILLSGRPGCGKTLSCRWLRQLCEQNNLAYRVITMEDYKEASSRGRVRMLFKLRGESGIIFFDDMDIMVKDRKKNGGGVELSTFLSELDGIDPAEGVVYVFTTNYIDELDEAFVRPGRIDLWLPFRLPSVKLRRKFIDKCFNDDLKQHIKVDDIIKRTKDYSFAELEEIRKLFCMDLIDEKPISVNRTFNTFNKHRKDFEERSIMGFGSLEEEEDESDDFEELDFVPLPPRYR